jgi:hypothetical protein
MTHILALPRDGMCRVRVEIDWHRRATSRRNLHGATHPVVSQRYGCARRVGQHSEDFGMRYRVMVKKFNAYQAWTTRGTYGSEAAALSMAERLARDHAFVRVVDSGGHVLWSA